ncbi:MAG TPA: ABC transporter permease [Acidimicrobiia bacterium]|jgi:sulfonate transport system permease protein
MNAVGLDTPALVTLPTRTTGTTSGSGARVPRRKVRVPTGVERLLGVLLLLALWQLASSTGHLSSDTLAGPISIGRSAWHLTQDGTLQSAIWVSLKRVLFGLAIGVPIATVLAIVAGLSRVGDDLVDAPMQMLRFLPIIGLQPLVVLWFGIGETAKVSLIAFAVAFPIYINTYAAIRAIDPKHLELARVVELRRSTLLRRVVVPGALPGFLVGLRMAVAVSWLILVFAEQINATNGIGYLMVRAQEFFQTDVILVGLAVYAVLGLFSDALVRALERKALAWRSTR